MAVFQARNRPSSNRVINPAGEYNGRNVGQASGDPAHDVASPPAVKMYHVRSDVSYYSVEFQYEAHVKIGSEGNCCNIEAGGRRIPSNAARFGAYQVHFVTPVSQASH